MKLEELHPVDISVMFNDGKVMHNTSLYSQDQYQAVNAKTWASKVFIKN